MGADCFVGQRRVREPASFERPIGGVGRMKAEVHFSGFAENQADLMLADLDNV
jgi:hypothetical protein